jgi:hypothetical protein
MRLHISIIVAVIAALKASLVLTLKANSVLAPRGQLSTYLKGQLRCSPLGASLVLTLQANLVLAPRG